MRQFTEYTIVDSSGPVALPMGRALRTDSTSSHVTTILLNPTQSKEGIHFHHLT